MSMFLKELLGFFDFLSGEAGGCIDPDIVPRDDSDY
jgi:hypothetical protein